MVDNALEMPTGRRQAFSGEDSTGSLFTALLSRFGELGGIELKLSHQKCYHENVATEDSADLELTQKRSVTLPRGLIAEVEALAGPRGFSAATADALTHWAQRTRIRRAIEAYEAEEGEITQAEMDAVVAKMGGL